MMIEFPATEILIDTTEGYSTIDLQVSREVADKLYIHYLNSNQGIRINELTSTIGKIKYVIKDFVIHDYDDIGSDWVYHIRDYASVTILNY
jgi:hypothetical protein